MATLHPARKVVQKNPVGCWHWESDIGHNVEHPTLCGRCVEAVKPFKA